MTRYRAVLLASFGAFALLACLVATVLAKRSGASASPPAGAARSPSAVSSANLVPSSLALGESVPPPPSLSEVYGGSHELSPRCEALRSTNQRLLAESSKRLGPSPPCSINLVVESLGCTTAENGVTWGYRLASATAVLPKDASSDSYYYCRSKWRLELVREHRADERVVPGAEVRLDVAYDDIVDLSLQALSDYDRDGEPELLKTVWRKAHEGDGVLDARVLTYRAGRIQEYAPSRGLHIDGAEDVDGDGLLDLMSAGPYATVKAQSDIGASYAIAPSLFAYHAERDGSFAMPTPASIAYAERQCPRREVPELAAGDINLDNATELARSLMCARMWGAEAAQIEARFRTICPKTYEQWQRDLGARQGPDAGDENLPAIYSCREWVLELARIEPPFTFERTH